VEAHNTDAELLNIPLHHINMGDRARKTYPNLGLLAQDIKQKGLIHPIAVQRVEGEDKPFLLLAGGRRMSAAVLAKLPTIPARVYPSTLSELDRREIELMENVSREGLSWPEEIALRDEIHKLQIAKFGAAHGSAGGHSQADTAKILGVSTMTVSRDLKLARGLEEFPDLAKAKSASEALLTLERLERQAKDKKLTDAIDDAVSKGHDQGYRTGLINGYIVGDFFARIDNIPTNAVGLVEIDPPYAIALHHNKRDTTHSDIPKMLDDYSEIPDTSYPAFLRKLFSSCYRVSGPNSWLICWCAYQHLRLVYRSIRSAGYNPHYIPGFWIKPNGQCNHPELYLGNTVECFLYAKKGEATIRRQGRLNSFIFSPVHPDRKIHPTERPVELMADIIQTFVGPNTHIMVPFLGSGNTLLAASNSNCTGFGFDLSDTYRAGYIRRVTEGTLRSYTSYA